jgi:hypothetical protein
MLCGKSHSVSGARCTAGQRPADGLAQPCATSGGGACDACRRHSAAAPSVPTFPQPCSHTSDHRHHLERSKDERLDRKDGTGRGHVVEKKGGAGKGNWGSLIDHITE